MGNLFGGSRNIEPSGFLQPQPFNIPGEELLMGQATQRSQSALPFTAGAGQRTIDYGFGEYDPQTMGMQLPQFQPTPPQQNPWIPQNQFPMGGFAFQPPFNNVGFNPGQAASPFNQLLGQNPVQQGQPSPESQSPPQQLGRREVSQPSPQQPQGGQQQPQGGPPQQGAQQGGGIYGANGPGGAVGFYPPQITPQTPTPYNPMYDPNYAANSIGQTPPQLNPMMAAFQPPIQQGVQ